MSIFIDFRIHFGNLLGPTLGTNEWFSVIWDVKVGDSFKVHLSGDPGMEMMPEFRGWMCLNHCKYNGFWRISLLSPIHQFGVGEMFLGVILTPVGDLRATFSDFLRYWTDIGIFIDLAWFPETPWSEATHKSEGKMLIQPGSKQPTLKHSGCKIQAIRL